tara:strand:- start:256 stop:501 length:246 start_codon:yes stop_codon:yes gene_type:complete
MGLFTNEHLASRYGWNLRNNNKIIQYSGRKWNTNGPMGMLYTQAEFLAECIAQGMVSTNVRTLDQALDWTGAFILDDDEFE